MTAPRTLHEAIEACAKACGGGQLNEYSTAKEKAAIGSCRTAIRALVAQWPDAALVPVEPTRKMIEAGYRAIGYTHYEPHATSKGWGEHAVDVYRAMLAAAREDGNG